MHDHSSHSYIPTTASEAVPRTADPDQPDRAAQPCNRKPAGFIENRLAFDRLIVVTGDWVVVLLLPLVFERATPVAAGVPSIRASIGAA